jgi:hypothetical protein
MRGRRRGNDRRCIGVFDKNRFINNFALRHSTDHNKFAFGYKAEGDRSGPARHQTCLRDVFGRKEIKRLLERPPEVIYVQ